MNIQWYPGHMTKTKRMIAEQIKFVDVVAEILDARIPLSSRNPEVDAITAGKPRLIIMNRADQADPEQNRRWSGYFKSLGFFVMETDAKTGAGVNQFSAVIKNVLRDQIARWREKGQVGRPVRAMVVGIPNVGKSTFINKVARRKSAKTADKPGVTRGKQWISVDRGLELLDTPGILWPKFEDQETGRKLAYTGAIRDEILDIQTLGFHLMELLSARYPSALSTRYKISVEQGDGGWELLERAAKKRGFLISGGQPDIERMASTLLDEFRDGRLGLMTLETPDD